MTVPAVIPTLNLNFAKTRKLDSRITFSRASTATYVGADGLIKSVASNVARFDHDPATRKSLGLVMEGSRTNQALYSEDFSNAVWNKTNATVSANATTAPDGTVTADKLLETTANASHVVGQNVTVTASSTYCFSVFVKAAERTRLMLVMGGAGQSPQESVAIDLSTATASPGGSTAIYGIKAYPGGWYRVWVGGVAESTTLAPFVQLEDASGNLVYAGSATSGLYLWGAQLESISVSSYIPTTSASATRSPDIANITGSNFSSWFNAIEGTFYAAYVSSSLLESATRRVLKITDTAGVFTNAMFLGNNGTCRQYVATGGVVQADQGSAMVADSRNSAALSYAANAFAVSGNGGSAITDSAGTVPAVSLLCIGGDGLGTSSLALNGTIERLAYIPAALTAAELQTLSAY